MSVAAVLLDFDGVVVDSHIAHLEAWKIACRDLFQYKIIDVERLIGRSGRDIAYELAGEAGYKQRAIELYEYKSKLIHDQFHLIPLLPGVRPFVDALEANNIPYGIGSNARSHFIVSLLNHHKLKHPQIVAFDHVKRAKPHPEMFITCAEKLGIDKADFKRVLVFDDSPIGLTAARAAGMIPIGVTTQMTAARLKQHGAEFTCSDLNEAYTKHWYKHVPEKPSQNF